MANAQQILTSIANSSESPLVNSLMQIQKQKQENDLHNLQMQQEQQSLSDKRTSFGNRVGRNVDIYNPNDQSAIVNDISAPKTNAMPADALFNAIDKGVDPAAMARKSLDKLLSGTANGPEDIAPLRQYLTEQQAKEIRYPWDVQEKAEHAATAGGIIHPANISTMGETAQKAQSIAGFTDLSDKQMQNAYGGIMAKAQTQFAGLRPTDKTKFVNNFLANQGAAIDNNDNIKDKNAAKAWVAQKARDTFK